MRCKKLRKIYPKYTDGELPEEQRQSVEEHIRDCPDCSTEVGSLRKMRSLLPTFVGIVMTKKLLKQPLLRKEFHEKAINF